MKLVDLPEIMKIELEAFSAPWPSAIFIREILGKTSYPMVARIVEKGQAKIVGFGVCRITADHLHITNIAVHRRYRRRGFARKLLRHMCELGKSRECASASLEVRVSNKKAIRLYEKEGFLQRGRIAGYYEDNNEDALICVKIL